MITQEQVENAKRNAEHMHGDHIEKVDEECYMCKREVKNETTQA